MADAKRYFLYARKSTDVEDKQVRSIDAQLSELHEFAQRNAVTISEVIIERESAKTPGKRREFNSMLDRIERGDADGILSWHPDRLARNMTDGGRIIDLIDTGKIAALRFPSFWFDTTPQGKFMLSMAFSQSKFYVDSLAVNTRMGLMEKVRRGEFPSAAPIGYLNDRKVKRIVLDPIRGPIVRQAFERYAEGNETFDSLRRFFADAGVMSKGGKVLSRAAINIILSNPIYHGSFKWAGDVYNGKHEPIVTKRLFDNVQMIMTQRTRRMRASQKPAPRPYAGLLRCGSCGYAITAERQRGHTYYHCTRKSKIMRCTEPYIREEALDAEIVRLIMPYSLREDWAEQMLSALAADEKQATSDAHVLIARKRALVEKLQAKISRLLDVRLEGEMDPKIYTERKSKFMSQKKSLEEDMAEIIKGNKPWLEPLKTWILAAKNLSVLAETGSPSDRKGLAEKIFGSNMFLSRKKARGEAVKPWAFLADNEFNLSIVHLLDAARTFYQENQPS